MNQIQKAKANLILAVVVLCVLWLMVGCAPKAAHQTPAGDLPTFDEGDRVCVLVNPQLIYCQPKRPKTIT